MYVTLNVKPSREVVIGLVLASSGQVIAMFSNILDIFWCALLFIYFIFRHLQLPFSFPSFLFFPLHLTVKSIILYGTEHSMGIVT